MSGKFNKLFWAVLVGSAVVAALGYAASPLSGMVRTAPIAVELVPGTAMSEEQLAEETLTAAYLFDRDTTTEYRGSGSASVIATLEREQELRAVKLFGAAPYAVGVKALRGEIWEPVAGLQDIDLSRAADAWHSYQATEPVVTTQVRIDLTPVEQRGGGPNRATGLKEVELWVSGDRVRLGDVAVLVPLNEDSELPDQARHYLAAEDQGVIGPLELPPHSPYLPDDPEDNFFTVTIDRATQDIRRAWLMYETHGIAHWVSAVRTVNGVARQGGGFTFVSEDWAPQIEPINPEWLFQGENVIGFAVPEGEEGNFAVRNVGILVEHDDGGNFVSYVAGGAGGAVSPVPEAYDGDLQTGWVPYAGVSRGGQGQPSLEFLFDRPVQLDAFEFYLSGELSGSISREYLADGSWRQVSRSNTQARNLVEGWNALSVTEDAMDGVRIEFSGGTGSDAQVRDVRLVGSAVGPGRAPRLTVTYPEAGEYYGRTAHIRGFLQAEDNGSGLAQVFVGGIEVPVDHGAFQATITKEDVGLRTQRNSEPWEVQVRAVYPDRQELVQTVVLNDARDGALTLDRLRMLYALAIAAGGERTLRHDEAELEVVQGAVDQETTLTIQSLSQGDLAPLEPGMTNVTKGPRAGYRFTPKGMKFKKAVQVRLPYDKKLIPEGLTEADVRTYYYDVQTGRWTPLERLAVQSASGYVISATDHFTDMINATIVVPEHPQMADFNPTSIKDIKAADPGAGIALIEPPQANNTGDATLSYPIEVPPGRAGMQPQLAIGYSSGGGNGWLGTGWDIAIPAVTVDTRWGVPRYDAANETETYLLDGQMLTPVAHRGDTPPRSGNKKTFYPRVEGPFRTIVRHGTGPHNYHWEVTDKSGRTFYYGGDGTALDPTAVLAAVPGESPIFKWMLTKVVDPNGNYMSYGYARVIDPGLRNGGVDGYQTYPATISYTGHDGMDGAYRVDFLRDRDLGEELRHDVSIDARAGFKVVTADLLRRIEVRYGEMLVRQYELSYRTGAFHKTLLADIAQMDADTALAVHTFRYHQEDATTHTFVDAGTWNSGGDGITAGLRGFGAASALSASVGQSVGGDAYIGFSPPDQGKKISGGVKVGYSRASNEGVLSLIDIDGDGIPDKVFHDGGLKYRAGQRQPDGTLSFGAPVPIVGLPGTRLSKDSSESIVFGGEVHFAVKGYAHKTFGSSETSEYFSDVNGDGLPDFVVDGLVYFNLGGGRFSPDSSGTPVRVVPGQLVAEGLIDEEWYEQLYMRQLDIFPLLDTVRRWTAPYDGTVRISGEAVLTFEPENESWREYATDDGVKLSIQHAGNAPVFHVVGRRDTSPVDFDLGLINVKKGESIYFRVQSVFDGEFDIVDWNPRIEYLHVDQDYLDVNLLPAYVYQASADFVYAGRGSSIEVPATGTVQIMDPDDTPSVVLKTGVTSDDVTVAVYRNGELMVSHEFRWDETGTRTLDEIIEVTADDRLSLIVRADSAIDLTKIEWFPTVVYLDAVAEEGGDAPMVVDEDGNYQFKLLTPYDIDMYHPVGLNSPQEPWIAPKTGLVYLVPHPHFQFEEENPSWEDGEYLDHSAPDPINGEIFFTVKRRAELVAKQSLRVEDSRLSNPHAAAVALHVEEGEELFLDLSTRDYELAEYFRAAAVGFAYSEPEYFTIPLDGPVKVDTTLEFSRPWDDGESEQAPPRDTLLYAAQQDGRIFSRVPVSVEDYWVRDADSLNYIAELEKGGDAYFDIVLDSSLLRSRLRHAKTTLTYGWQQVWRAPMSGAVTVTPAPAFEAGDAPPNGTVEFRLSKNGKTVATSIMNIVDGQLEDPASHTVPLNLNSEDELQFVFRTSNRALASTIADSGGALLTFNQGAHWMAPTDTVVTVVPSILLDIEAEVEIGFEIHVNGSLVDARQLVIDRGASFEPEVYATELSVAEGDIVAFVYRSDRQDVTDAVRGSDVTLRYVVDEAENPVSATVSAEFASAYRYPGTFVIYDIPINAHLEQQAESVFHHAREIRGIFHVPYRGWSYFVYNGNLERADARIDESELSTEAALDRSLYNENYESNYSSDRAEEDQKSRPVYPMYPLPAQGRWVGPDHMIWVRSGTVSSSRLGLKYFEQLTSEKFAGANAVKRLSSTEGVAAGISGSGGGATFSGAKNIGTSVGELDFIDMNGDGFPDIVSIDHIQYTRPDGALEEAKRRTAHGYVRKEENEAYSGSVGGSSARSDATGSGHTVATGTSSGKTSRKGSVLPGFGVSGSLGGGTGDSVKDFIDINGDGLPDRVQMSNGQIVVQLNLGYGFAPAADWSPGDINRGSTSNYSLLNLGYTADENAYGGGVSVAKSETSARRTLLDINGDGLPDYLVLRDGGIDAYINTGAGFADVPVLWTGASQLTLSGNISASAGAYVKIPPGPICLVACYLIINFGGNASETMARQEVALRDINGNGLPDFVRSTQDNELHVALNTATYANFLVEVTRPLGATTTLDYARSEPSYHHPGGKWVLSEVTIDDGIVDDGPNQVTRFDYQNGYRDRWERDFYGFGRVVETQLDDEGRTYRQIVRDYENDNYYSKGLLVMEEIQDAAGRVYQRTTHSYELRDLGGDSRYSAEEFDPGTARVYPRLERTDRDVYEPAGGGGSKSTYVTYQYDAWGNVTRFFDAADVGNEDDVQADVQYVYNAAAHIYDRPAAIMVSSNGVQLRRREAAYDDRGNLIEVRQYLDGRPVTTRLSYDRYGNLSSVQGPPNHKGEFRTLSFGYDDVVQTHVVGITDNEGYSSSASYDYAFGQVLSTTDRNGNTKSRSYDSFGRTVSLTGPYQQGSGRATIAFEYRPDADVPYAITRHYDPYRDPNGAETIDTVLFTDGLKRVVQTKKSAERHVGPDQGTQRGMTVSGRIRFDALGRGVAQHYPTFEPAGQGGVFNPVFHAMASHTGYDVLDRTTESVLPDGATTRIAYGIAEDRQVTTVTDAEGKVKVTHRDLRQLITAVQEHIAGQVHTTRYGYDPLKQITRVTDAHGHHTTVDYDDLGRRTAIDNPDTGRVEMEYDLMGNLIRRITPNLRAAATGNDRPAIEYEYAYDRLISIRYPHNPDHNVDYRWGEPGAPYNRAERIWYITHQAGSEERAYGKLGELIREHKQIPVTQHAGKGGSSGNDVEIFTTHYEYDSFGRLQKLVYPDGDQLHYHYDAGGQVARIGSVKDGKEAQYVNRIEYDEFGDRAFIEYANGMRSRYSYDPQTRRLSQLQTQGLGRTVQNLSYGYDRVGNITERHNALALVAGLPGPSSHSYGYDDLHRLTSASGSYRYDAANDERYTLDMAYDAIHNITRKHQQTTHIADGQSSVREATSYDWLYAYQGPQPHAPTRIGERSFHYDANGNLSGWEQDGGKASRSLIWDEENRLQRVEEGKQITRFKYDDQGNRVIKYHHRPNSGTGQETIYVNPHYAVTNRAVVVKHIFVGASRMVAKQSGGSILLREDADLTEERYLRAPPPGQGKGPGTGEYAPHPGQGKALGHDQQNPGQGRGNQGNQGNQGRGQGRFEEGQHPGQGIDRRSERANEVAQNVHKNPHLAHLRDGDGASDADGGEGDGPAPIQHEDGTLIEEEILVIGPLDERVYYYHPDHLGSTAVVTDQDGNVHEHIEYFPFGETWIQHGGNNKITPYLYTSKELDRETGLYYFGARYYDPRTSVWQSPDPVLGAYLPRPGQKVEELLGLGGIFNSSNLGLYSYSHQKPTVLTDPDGNSPFHYNALNGIQAHNLFSDYVESRGMQANSALSRIAEGLGLPKTRPDARDPVSSQIWELKPITHKNRPDLRAKDQGQVSGYLGALGAAGLPHTAGDPAELAPDVPGGTYIGSFEAIGGTTFDVNIYPGEDQGMIYYSLTPQKTGVEKLGELVKEVGEGLARSGPGNWMNQGPLVRPVEE